MTELNCTNGIYSIKKKTPFAQIGNFKSATINNICEFAYNMSFGKLGKHRANRSGGLKLRSDIEIFIDAFQGKLSECALYNQFYKEHEISTPDFSTYELGKWDDTDFIINNKYIAVKSTKYYGNILLLETKDWSNKGEYIPNINKVNKGIFISFS